VTDAGLRHLAQMRELRDLYLNGCSVTDDSLDHLKQLTNLRTLVVTGTRISAAGAQRLRAALPKCTVQDF
jgi:hypothetical protein